jgi:CheY-like chemotaxis protein
MIENSTFLYVEDDPLSRKVMEMLMVKGMHVKRLTIFEDSSDFINRLQSLSEIPAMIMLDIQVQPYDGFEMLAMIRALTGYEQSKIVALTASVMNEEVEKLQTSGFDGAIGKPLTIQTFPELIANILNGQSIWHIV